MILTMRPVHCNRSALVLHSEGMILHAVRKVQSFCVLEIPGLYYGDRDIGSRVG